MVSVQNLNGIQQVTAKRTNRKAEGKRTCIVTRSEGNRDQLIRFALGPDGAIVPDLSEKLPGRGVWVTCNAPTVAEAAQNNHFARSFKRQVIVSNNLSGIVQEQITERVLALLSLANKAGLAFSGFQKVEAALNAGEVAVLVQACDAAEDGRHKLDRKFIASAKDSGQKAQVCDQLTVAQISLAMGRPFVVHAALKSGGLTEKFVREAERLKRFGPSANISLPSA